MKLFNWHIHTYSVVDSKGYQYCTICNKAKLVGTPKCNHSWEILEKINVIGHNSVDINAIIYVQQCTLCGEINQHKVKD